MFFSPRPPMMNTSSAEAPEAPTPEATTPPIEAEPHIETPLPPETPQPPQAPILAEPVTEPTPPAVVAEPAPEAAIIEPALEPAPVTEPTADPVVAEVEAEIKQTEEPHTPVVTVADDVIVRAKSLADIPFADIWNSPENISYIRDTKTRFALTPIETEDLPDFRRSLEQAYTGSSSYTVKFAGESYRVERITTTDGVQYNCRKMPKQTPDIFSLGLPQPVVKHLTTLGRESGLILLAGPTGMGKTTTASALMKYFLETDGGFMYTIEDPPEMPLSGLYQAKNGGLGLCKQTPVENEQWGPGLRSALRSRPRYILVGEIRTPETASQCLVAATSGHFVMSTIHANSVEDALNSIIKYASSTGLDEGLVSDLLARGVLGVIHQKLVGTQKLAPEIHSAFANPNPLEADQMRMTIRSGTINLSTFMEMQQTRMTRNLPLFREM